MVHIRHHIVLLVVLVLLVQASCTKNEPLEEPISAPRAVLTQQEHARADSFFQQATQLANRYRIKPALDLFDATLKVDSTHYLAHFQRGVLLRRLNDFEASSEAYQQAILYKDDFLDAWYNLANNAFWQNQHVDAIRLYDQLLERGEAPAFFHNKGRAQLALGNYEAALESFRESIRVDFSYAYGYASLGALYEQQGEYEAMHTQYKRAVQFEPASDEYRYKLGMAEMRLNNIDNALVAWDETLELNPFHFGALFNKGKVLNQQGRPEASSLLEKAEAIRQEDAEIQRLRRGSERFPDDAYYRHALGNLYAERQQWEAAAREFRIAIELEPEDIRSMINLGNVHVSLNKFQEAIDIYENALALEQNSTDVLQNLAIVSMRQGQSSEALAYWNRILEIDPAHTVAKRGVQQLKR